jgi:HPr kinase/phosphorylase
MVGSTEWSYLESVGQEKRKELFQKLSDFRSPLWVLTHNLKPHAELIAMCEQQNAPLISTQLQTVDFARATQRILEEYFAPYTSVHASLVDVYGVGMLYLGESNVGKSECVLDLVERGHRLVADDVVQLSHIGNSIIGRSNSLIRHHMEIRGIGIIDVRSMFGIHAVRKVKKVEVIVELQPWQQNTSYDRTGLSSTINAIMGVNIPRVLIPVSPGKNLTVISEVIAMNTLMKMNGFDTANAFNESLLKAIELKTQGRRTDDAFEEDPLNWEILMNNFFRNGNGNKRTAFFILIFIFFVFSLWFFIHPSSPYYSKTKYVLRFSEIGSLSPGNHVQVNGLVKGKIKKVDITDDYIFCYHRNFIGHENSH